MKLRRIIFVILVFFDCNILYVVAEEAKLEKYLLNYMNKNNKLFEDYLNNEKYFEETKRNVEKNPADELLHIVLGAFYLQREKYEEALKEFEYALKINPNSINAILFRGITQVAIGKIDETINTCEEMLKNNSNDEGLHLVLGLAYARSNEYNEAIKQYEECIRLSPSLIYPYQALIVIYRELGKIDKAIEICKKSLYLHPNTVENHSILADLYMESGDIEKSKEELEKILAIEPGNMDAKSSLMLMVEFTKNLDKDKFDNIYTDNESVTKIKCSIFYGFDKSKENYYRAIENISKGRIDDAEKELDIILSNDSGNIDLKNYIAILYNILKRPDKSIQLLKEIENTNPDYPGLYFQMGNAYSVKGEFTLAEEMYKESLKRGHIKKEQIYGVLGFIYEGNGQYDKALDYFKKGLEENQMDKTCNLGIAYYYFEKGQYNDAIEIYDKMLEYNPNDTDMLMGLANAYTFTNEYEKALECFNKIMQITKDKSKIDACKNNIKILEDQLSSQTKYQFILPKSPKLREALECLRSGELEKAKILLMQEVSDDPNNTTARGCLAKVYLEQNNIPEAFNEVNVVLEMDKDNAYARWVLGQIYFTRKDLDNAIKEFNRAYELNKKDVAYIFNLAQAYAAKLDFIKAELLFQELLTIDPDAEEARVMLSYIYTDQEKYELAINQCEYISDSDYRKFDILAKILALKGELNNAVAEYEKSIAINPNNIDAYIELGKVYRMKENYSKSIECFDKAIQINPRCAEAYELKGIILGKNKMYDKAIESLQRAMELDPNNYELYYNLGVAYLHHGDDKKSIECLNKYIIFEPNNADAYHALAYAYYYIGQYPKAIENFDKAKAKGCKNLDHKFENALKSYR